MATQRWFTVETADPDLARAAFFQALALACPSAVAAYVPAAWQDAADLPREAANPYLPAGDSLAPGDFLRFDFALRPTTDGQAHAVNMLVSAIGSRAGNEGSFGTALTAWWRAQPLGARPVSAATAAEFPDAAPSPAWAQTVAGVTVRLLETPPDFPRLVFA